MPAAPPRPAPSGGGLDLDALEAEAAAAGGTSELGSRRTRDGRSREEEAARAADKATKAARFEAALTKANWASHALRQVGRRGVSVWGGRLAGCKARSEHPPTPPSKQGRGYSASCRRAVLTARHRLRCCLLQDAPVAGGDDDEDDPEQDELYHSLQR
jgi:hypothetical protein